MFFFFFFFFFFWGGGGGSLVSVYCENSYYIYKILLLIIDSSNTPLVVEALKKRLDKQEETTQLIENELENEKDKRINLETIVESLKEKSKVVEEEAMTTKDAMERFTFIMKSAFKAEKSLLRNLAKTVNIDILKDIFEKEINAVMVTTNKSIQSVRKDITILKDEIIKVDEMVDKNGEDIDQLNFTLADTDGRVDANEQQLESMSGCCSGKQPYQFSDWAGKSC